MKWATKVISAAAGVVMFGSAVHRRRELHGMVSRPHAAREWMRAFPKAHHGEIRDFLRVFVDGLGLSRSHLLRFRPGDRIAEVYRATHGPRGAVHGMELENLARLLEQRYGIELREMWREELTLGEVFGKARGHGGHAGKDEG